MADFLPAFEKMIKNEGGYRLHKVKGDRGGMTYAGIARKFHPEWGGWKKIDAGDYEGLTPLVRCFYLGRYWGKVKGDEIKTQRVAESLFDFAVNAGVRTASKLAQITAGATPDGAIGEKTIQAINAIDAEIFILRYFVAKVSRYAFICNKNRSQSKFLLGWTNRALKGVS